MSDHPAPPATPARKTGRGVKIALGLSLALNLVIAGAIGGAVLSGRAGPGGDEGVRDLFRVLGLGPLGVALDRDDRAALIDRATQDPAALRAARGALIRATRDFARAVRAEPFDRAGAEAALRRQREFVAGLQTRGHELLLDQIAAMPPEARQGFADRLTRRLRAPRER